MLEVKNLTKTYNDFKLDNVSFNLEPGYIMGFIGANGAGKTTTLKSILNFVHPDSGTVNILGKDFFENEIMLKPEIGMVFGQPIYYPKHKIKAITDVYKRFYENWDEESYQKYINRFKLDENKKISELSSGMKVKYYLALALSHKAKLFILDEPTSGLDPVSRNEILTIFQDIVESGEKSILFSTHITSDLDKCADFIILIKDGKLLIKSTKDDVIDGHKLIKGKLADLTEEIKNNVVSYVKNKFSFTGLIRVENNNINLSNYTLEKPNLEDIMIFYNKEGIYDEN